MNAPIPNKSPKQSGSRCFTRDEIHRFAVAIGGDSDEAIEKCAAWVARTELVAQSSYKLECARGIIRNILQLDARHNSRVSNQLAYIVENYGKTNPSPAMAKQVVVECAEASTPVVVDSDTVPQGSIVRVVDGITFSLPSLDRSGAEAARVTLTDLATSLGYSDKSKLKQLAERHASELAEFGVVTTVAVTVPGRFGQVIQEPTYNPDQAAYLALSSETPQGRACRVRILKAYKSLLSMFEQVVQQSQGNDPFLRQLLQGQQAQTQALTALTMALAGGMRRRIRRAAPEQQTIPQTEDPPKSDPVAADPPKAEPTTAGPTPVQKLRASGRLALLPTPGKVQSRDVCDAIHRVVKTVSEVSGWHYDDLFNGVYDRIQIEMKWNPREKPASEKSALKYIGSQSHERKLECYRIAYEVLVATYLG